MSEEIEAHNELLLRAYNVCFGSADGQIVFADLARYCRAVESTFDPQSERRSAFLEGRRDVVLRIQQFSRLTIEEIMQLRLGRINPKPTGADE